MFALCCLLSVDVPYLCFLIAYELDILIVFTVFVFPCYVCNYDYSDLKGGKQTSSADSCLQRLLNESIMNQE